MKVTTETLASWHAVLEPDDVPVGQTRMVYAVNQSTAAVLEKLATVPRLGSLGLQFSPGWHEKNDRTKGFFDSEWGVPESWDQVILQGPHLFVATPMYKSPNATMLHHLDWTETDLEALESDAIPATSFKPRGDGAKYDSSYTHWRAEPDGLSVSRDFYRVAWRRMAANTGERTLIPAIIPRGAAHTHLIYSTTSIANYEKLPLIQAFAGSLLADFMVRSAPKNDIIYPTFRQLPFNDEVSELSRLMVLRTLRLNCVTAAYADLWTEHWHESFVRDLWTDNTSILQQQPLGEVRSAWSREVPLRNAVTRRQAALEIDALAAIALGISADELTTIYRTQFPVLFGYDRRSSVYDANGRSVPSSLVALWRRRGMNDGHFVDDDLTEVHPGSGLTYRYETPFRTLDREHDLRAAYTEFQERLASRT